MDAETHEVGREPHIVVQSVGGDTRLTGGDGQELHAKAPQGSGLKVAQEKGRVVVSSRSDLLLMVPRRSRVEVHATGGDVRVLGLKGDLMVGTAGGDVSLGRVAGATLGRIGGDLQARGVEGDLVVKSGAGDALVERVTGEVRLQGQGGDLELSEVSGPVQAQVGGDVLMAVAPSPGTSSRVIAGGDLSCRLEPGSSLRARLRAGGNVHLEGVPEPSEEGEALEVRLGSGEAEMELRAGGDLWLRVAEPGAEGDLGGALAARIGSKMAEVEARLGALGAGLAAFDSERIGEDVRKAIVRATRRAAAARARGRRGRDLGAVFSASGARVRPPGDEERLAVLRMLEKGVIQVEEAERLLKALEGEG